MKFNGKTVVITGAASGIGRATVMRFAAEGAEIIAADINAPMDIASSPNSTEVSSGQIRRN